MGIDLEILGNAVDGNLHRIQQFVEHPLRALLPDRNRRHRVLIALDDAEVFQLPAEHHLQRRMMQCREVYGETQRMAGCLRTVDSDHDGTLAPRQGRTGKIIGDIAHRGRQRIGDGVLHAGFLVVQNADHGDGDFRLFRKRCGQGSQEPTRHASQGTSSDDDLLRVLADFQKRRCAGRLDGSQFDAILVDGHALRRFRDPIAQLACDLMACLGPLAVVLRFRPHIPGVGPCVDRVDLLSGKRCLMQRPTQRREGFVGTVDADHDVVRAIRIKGGITHFDDLLGRCPMSSISVELR